VTDARREELEKRLRKNRGRQLFADWSQSLSAACGIEIAPSSFLSIEETEKLKTAFLARVKLESRAGTITWFKNEKTDLVSHLVDLCDHAGSLSVILFNKLDQFIGAPLVPADCVLRNVLEVWDVVEEDLDLASKNLDHGLCLEVNFYTPLGQYIKEGVYEMTTWGLFSKKKGIRS
jgi:hypothetical protein